MADNQPAQTPAPDGKAPEATPQEPEQKPAEQQPAAITLDSFSDDEKKYLESQGVKDFSNVEDIKKVINHARSSQKTASEIKAELDKVKSVVTPQSEPANPLLQPEQQKPAEPTQQPEQKGIDEITMFNLSTNLALSFPELKEELTSGKLFKDVQEQGTPLYVSGQVNLNGILKYAENAQKVKKLEAQLEELTNKPGGIPDAKPDDKQTVADDAPMTKQIAQAILLQDPNGHPRAQEAKDFIAKN